MIRTFNLCNGAMLVRVRVTKDELELLSLRIGGKLIPHDAYRQSDFGAWIAANVDDLLEVKEREKGEAE